MGMLDPFGKRARQIILEFGGIEDFLLKIPGYVEPGEILARVNWKEKPPLEVLELNDWKDLMTFYALLGALALSPYGLEMELVQEKNAEIYLYRIGGNSDLDDISLRVRKIEAGEIPEKDQLILEKTRYRELDEGEKKRLRLEYKMWLRHFIPLWRDSLKDIYIRNSWAYLRRDDVLCLWRKAFERNLERAVDLLYDVRDELPEFYSELREKLNEVAREQFKERIKALGSAEAVPLRPELFPPCVKKALSGVGSGMRNYAITVLLTSFLSYARICPNPPRRNIRIKDCVDNLSVVENEILPVIIDAGNRCRPPLFEDQPNEIKNIWYHLGFGFTDKPSFEDSGNSTWYFPPNCDKIRANAPELCKPDGFCRGIKNPLTYYLKRLYLKRKEGRE